MIDHSPKRHKKDGRVLVIAAAIIAGLGLARDPRARPKGTWIMSGERLGYRI
jgi:hypothetical protein